MVDDRRIVCELRDLIDRADALVAHYGSRFDLPFVNTRCLEHGELPPAPATMIDTWRIARNTLAMTSNRLKNTGGIVCFTRQSEGRVKQRAVEACRTRGPRCSGSHATVLCAGCTDDRRGVPASTSCDYKPSVHRPCARRTTGHGIYYVSSVWLCCYARTRSPQNEAFRRMA
jgi:hypothetical protein